MRDLDGIGNELAALSSDGGLVVSPSIFETALGEGFNDLPEPIKAVHDRRARKRFTGKATIRRSYGLLLNAIAAWIGFPKAGEDIEVEVIIERTADGEVWTRRFGDNIFRSHLSLPENGRPGRIVERFKFLSFDIDLDNRLGRLYYPIGRGRIGPFPLPLLLNPRSDTVEHLTTGDKFYFSVKIELPFVGHLVTYEGWLLDATASQMTLSATG